MYARIKKLREKHKLSIEQISEYLNISTNSYKTIEDGKKNVSILVLSKLAKKYNTSIDYIIGNTNTPIPHKKN